MKNKFTKYFALFFLAISMIYSQNNKQIEVEYTKSQIIYFYGIDDSYMYSGSLTRAGSLARHDFTFLFNDMYEIGYFTTSGDFSIVVNPGGYDWDGEDNTDYPVVNGKNVSYLSEMKFSGLYTGLRVSLGNLFFSSRVGLGNEEYATSSIKYESNGIYLDFVGGFKKQFGIVSTGFTIGWNGIMHAVQSDLSDMNVNAGFNISINLGKIPTNITLPKPKPKHPTPIKRRDFTPPSIYIYSPITKQNIHRTEESVVTIRGKASDLNGIAFVKINNKNVHIKNDGSFIKRQKIKIGKNSIVVKAIDINGNASEKYFFVIREEFFEEEFSDVDFPIETQNKNKNGIAVVIGIEDYQYAPSVSFAYNDADIFREYLVTTFGFERENIYYKTNLRATKGEFEKVFSGNGWLANHSNRKSDIYIFYAGHGAPDLNNKGTYLIPSDIDPNYATTGYSLEDLYKNLGSIKAKSITVVLDACFSGGTRENQSLLADARPIYIEVESGNVSQNTVVFSAASGSEISSAYKQKNHGIFTYYFLKGLKGNADKNKDNKITVSEMQNYLRNNVSIQARKMGREQNPQLLGTDKKRVLLKY